MNTSLHYSLPGYGLGQSAGDMAVSAGTTLAQVAAPIALTQTAVGATVAGILGGAAIAIPVVGAAIAGISLGIEAILHSGCGESCIVTSQWANQAEALLRQNLNQYQAISPPRPRSVQQLALANFQATWNRLVQLCSQPGLSTAGANCISDRQAGSCKWKDNNGQCWNWWSGYHDPIANDTQVVNDSVAAGSTTGSSSAGPMVVAGGIDMTPIWIGVVVLGGLFMVSRL